MSVSRVTGEGGLRGSKNKSSTVEEGLQKHIRTEKKEWPLEKRD